MSFTNEPADPAAYMPLPTPVDYLGEPLDLNQLLTLLARDGGWIEAWYPLSNGAFECRLRFGGGIIHTAWSVQYSALQALYDALAKANVVVARDGQ